MALLALAIGEPADGQEVLRLEQTQAIVTEHTTTDTLTSDETEPIPDKPKRLQTAAVLERPKKAVPEKPAEPAKKKVTVDDLINDN